MKAHLIFTIFAPHRMLHIRPQAVTHTPRLSLTFRKFSGAAQLIQGLSFASGTTIGIYLGQM